MAGDTIEVLAASGLTHERLVALSEMLGELRHGDLSPDNILSAVAEEEPSLSPLLERVPPPMRRAFIVFLFALLQILVAQGLAELRDDAATRGDVQNAVETAVQRCITEGEHAH